MKSYEHILDAVIDQPWAILPEKLSQIQALLNMKLAGLNASAEDIAEMTAAAQQRPTYQTAANIAIVPVYGTLLYRTSPLAEMSGATSTRSIAAALREAVNDPGVKAVIMDIDSPGGQVFGMTELAAEIRKLREQKPIVAMVNPLAASAGYNVAASASEVVATPSALVGHIGIALLHMDLSKAAEMEGVTPTLMTAGKFKHEETSGSQYYPLTEEARAAFQSRVNAAYDTFVKDVAAGRGVSVQTVRNGYGEGRVVTASEAVRLGMADRVATLDETIARFAGGGRPSRRNMGAEVLAPIEVAADGTLSEEEVGEQRADFEAKFAGPENAHKVMELDAKESPEDAQAAARDADHLDLEVALAEAGLTASR